MLSRRASYLIGLSWIGGFGVPGSAPLLARLKEKSMEELNGNSHGVCRLGGLHRPIPFRIVQDRSGSFRIVQDRWAMLTLLLALNNGIMAVVSGAVPLLCHFRASFMGPIDRPEEVAHNRSQSPVDPSIPSSQFSYWRIMRQHPNHNRTCQRPSIAFPVDLSSGCNRFDL